MKMQLGKIKVIKGSLAVLSRTRRANCVYTLDGQAVSRKTLKGMKQLGEYLTGWKIKTWIQQQNGLVKEINVTLLAKEDHTFEVEPYGNVEHVVGSQEVQTQDLIYYHSAHDRKQHSAWELLCYREDSNEAAFAVGLKDDMDAQSDVYVLSNGCRKCSDNNDGYYWEYTLGLLDKAKGNVLGMEIVRDQSGDCDVEINGKWSCIYVVGSQEYEMVCTRLDIASADVGMLDMFDRELRTNVQVFVDFDYTVGRSITVMAEAGYMTLTEAAKEGIWLKGLTIELGFELKIVAGIATCAWSKETHVRGSSNG
ncbi:hypothetical protein Tco_1423907 [Tanacetum coccineum]